MTRSFNDDCKGFPKQVYYQHAFFLLGQLLSERSYCQHRAIHYIFAARNLLLKVNFLVAAKDAAPVPAAKKRLARPFYFKKSSVM